MVVELDFAVEAVVLKAAANEAGFVMAAVVEFAVLGVDLVMSLKIKVTVEIEVVVKAVKIEIGFGKTVVADIVGFEVDFG